MGAAPRPARPRTAEEPVVGMITTTQVLLGFAGILAALLATALFTLMGWMRGDLADLKKTVADIKTSTDLISGLADRLDRLEAERGAR